MYRGTVIEESLADKNILKRFKILSTRISTVTERHETLWLKQWTLHAVEIPEENAEEIAQAISEHLDPKHAWYADFCNRNWHYIVFRKKIFKIRRNNIKEYDKAKQYGLTLGIPAHQVDFHPEVKEWE